MAFSEATGTCWLVAAATQNDTYWLMAQPTAQKVLSITTRGTKLVEQLPVLSRLILQSSFHKRDGRVKRSTNSQASTMCRSLASYGFRNCMHLASASYDPASPVIV